MELRYILQILWRRRWIALNVFSAIVLTIVIGTMLITTSFDATSKVLLRKSSASSSLLSNLGLQSGTSSQTAISTSDRANYLALSTVKPVIEKVIADLHIKRERVRGKVMKAFPFLKPVLKVIGVDMESVEEIITAEDLIDSSIIANIFPRPYVEAEQYEETDIIEIKAKSTDPEEAMKIANAVANAFIEEELRRVREDYNGAKRFIDESTEKARDEYKKALQGLREFKEKEKIINVDSETQELITRISGLKKSMDDNALAITKTKASIEQIETQLKSMSKYQKISERIKENEVITPLKLTLRDLYVLLAESKTKYTKDHPSVIDIENKIAQTKDLLQNEIEKVFGEETTGIDPVYQDLTGKLAENYADTAGFESQNHSYQKIIKKYESEIMSLPRKVSDHAQLQLAITVTQDVYDSLLKYQYQVGMAESMALANIYLVESAVTPKIDDSSHRHPSLTINIIIALLLGTTFGIFASLLIDYMDDSIRTPDDIKTFKSVTFLGSVFKVHKNGPLLISAADPRSPIRESFRTIRNSIRFATLDSPPRSIIVTSCIEGEGKSFFSANLAISIVNEGKKVLIIDGDLRRPNVHIRFGIPNNIGLTNFLVGEMDAKNIQMSTGIEGLTIITSGPIPPDPARLVESKKMHQLVKEMEEIYDLVIIDTPPIMAASDAIHFGGWTGGTIIIIESGKASRIHFPEAIELLKHANINIIGAVLNKMAREGKRYYYQHSYYK